MQSHADQVIHILLDADGCIYNKEYYKSKSSESKLSEHSRIIKNNPALFAKMSDMVNAYPFATAHISCGSARQTYDHDIRISKYYQSGCIQDAIPDIICPHFQTLVKHKVYHDAYTLPDTFNKRADGSSARVSKLKSPWEGSKFYIVYAHVQRIALRYPNTNISVVLIDDRHDILYNLYIFFDVNSDLIPKNVSLILQPYDGLMHGSGSVTGTGIANIHYAKTLRKSHKFSEAGDAYNSEDGWNILRSFAKNKEKLSRFKEFHTMGSSKLRSAVHKRQYETVEKILTSDDRILLEKKNPSGNTALALAVNNNDTKMALLLIQSGADVNTRNDLNQELLPKAMSQLNPAMVKLLLDNGARIDVKNQADDNILNTAIITIKYSKSKNDAIAIIRIILKAIADSSMQKNKLYAADNKDIKSIPADSKSSNLSTSTDSILHQQNVYGETALLLLAENTELCRMPDITTFIIQNSPLDTKNNYGTSALIKAVEHGNYSFALELLNAGASAHVMNAGGKTALELLASQRNVSENHEYIVLIKKLLEKVPHDKEYERSVYDHTRFRYVNVSTGTALNLYVDAGHEISASIIMDAKFPLNTLNDKKETPLITSINNKMPSTAIKLIKLGASVTLCDPDGNSPIMLTILHNDMRTFDALMETKETRDMLRKENISGANPLSLAYDNGRLEMMRKLISCGAPVNVLYQNNNSLLMRSITKGDTASANLFIDAKTPLEIKNNNNETALFLAAKHNQTAIALKLIGNGANIDVINRKGKSIVDMAVKRKNLELVIALFERGAITMQPAKLYQFLASQNLTNSAVYFCRGILAEQKKQTNNALHNYIHALEHGNAWALRRIKMIYQSPHHNLTGAGRLSLWPNPKPAISHNNLQPNDSKAHNSNPDVKVNPVKKINNFCR